MDEQERVVMVTKFVTITAVCACVDGSASEK